MADLISKQQVCEVLAQFAPENYTQLVEMLVVKLPAVDAVEVVRCKDCLHWSSGENEAEKWEYCKFLNFDMGPYAFCIFGERREENGGENGKSI